MTRFNSIAMAVVVVLCLSPSGYSAEVRSASEMLKKVAAHFSSFDVRVRVIERNMINGTQPAVLEFQGEKRTIQEHRIIPRESASAKTILYRQVFEDQGKYPVELRRIEQFTDKSGETESILAYDGSVRRSLYNSHKSGLVAGPPDDGHQFVYFSRDYVALLGSRVPGRSERFADIAASLPPEEVEFRRDGSRIFVHLPPKNPSSAASSGFRLWFDDAHGMALQELQEYAITPDPDNNYAERTGLQLMIDMFTLTGDSVWAPTHAIVKTYEDRGRQAGALTSETELTVDTDNSSWNQSPSPDLFKFDFPSGTRVDNELIGVSFVVGDVEAGKNLDALIAGAKEKHPMTEEGRAAAGWDTQIAGAGGSALAQRVLISLNLIFLVTAMGLFIWRRTVRSADGRAR